MFVRLIKKQGTTTLRINQERKKIKGMRGAAVNDKKFLRSDILKCH